MQCFYSLHRLLRASECLIKQSLLVFLGKLEEVRGLSGPQKILWPDQSSVLVGFNGWGGPQICEFQYPQISVPTGIPGTEFPQISHYFQTPKQTSENT